MDDYEPSEGTKATVPLASGKTEVVLPEVELEPELRSKESEGLRNWTTIDLAVQMNAIKLHLYDQYATNSTNLKEHGIARFALNDNSMRLKLLSDGSAEAQVIFKSFTMNNTRPGDSKFREIIPAAQHDRNQFMVLYTSSAGINKASLVIVTIDSPEIIFAVDPVFALMHFFLSAFPSTNPAGMEKVASHEDQRNEASINNQSPLDFRVDLHNVSISVLEDDTKSETQSVQLTIHQMMLSQQVCRCYTSAQAKLTIIHLEGHHGTHCRPARNVAETHGFKL
jgi:vacuolar protein sorting-associated protein 13A/C